MRAKTQRSSRPEEENNITVPSAHEAQASTTVFAADMNRTAGAEDAAPKPLSSGHSSHEISDNGSTTIKQISTCENNNDAAAVAEEENKQPMIESKYTMEMGREMETPMSRAMDAQSQ